MRAGKFDGIPTPAMFEVADPGEHLAPAPTLFGRGEKAIARVWCPRGQHLVRVIDDGEHLRYATHWPIRGGGPDHVPDVLPVHGRVRGTRHPDHPAAEPGRRLPVRQAKGATMNENEPGGYCRQHGVTRDVCGCGHIPHLVQVMFDGDTTTPYCLCGWEGARWLTTITTNGWESASRQAREHVENQDARKHAANQQVSGGRDVV